MTQNNVYSDATQISGDVMIQVIGVDKYFGDFQALKGINLNVGKQEVVVVIGPSGSGKSTPAASSSTVSNYRTISATSRRSAVKPAWCSSSSICSRI